MQTEAEPLFKVEGDPNTVDSFAACLSAVARHFHLRSEYAYISGLVGTCFSPCHNRGEDCIGWKLDGGSAARAAFAAASLGLSVEKITLGPNGEASYFAQVKRAYHEGKALIPATWPAWSVLTGWEDNPAQLPFSTTPGFGKVVESIWPPAKTRIAYAFTLAEQAVNPRAVLRAALEYGAQVAAGSVVPGVENFGVENYFGGEIYKVIVEQAGKEFLCSGCGENGCFTRAVKRIADTQHASLAFLEEAQECLGAELPGLAAISEGYRAMASISHHYVDLARDAHVFDRPELRAEICTDFARLAQLHRMVAEQFQQEMGKILL